MLVPTVRLSVGLTAPPELIPPPEPWYNAKWAPLSQTGKRVWMGIGPAVAIIGLMINLSRGGYKSAAPGVVSPAPGQALPGPAIATAAIASKRPDSTTIALASKTRSKGGPSERAAAIMAYDKLKSSCPKRDTLASSKPIDYTVRMDSLRDRGRSDKMAISYDVCGLASKSPFTALFTLTKLRQRGFGQQPPRSETEVGTAASPRSHQKGTFDTHELSPGDYRLDVRVTDARKRQVNTSREFRFTDK